MMAVKNNVPKSILEIGTDFVLEVVQRHVDLFVQLVLVFVSLDMFAILRANVYTLIYAVSNSSYFYIICSSEIKKTIVAKITATPACGSNEFYSPCGDDGCQPKCPKIEVMLRSKLSPVKHHTDICRPECSSAACICKPGYIRDSEGHCIRPEMCRKGFIFHIHFL